MLTLTEPLGGLTEPRSSFLYNYMILLKTLVFFLCGALENYEVYPRFLA
jgi:hypothetical protein